MTSKERTKRVRILLDLCEYEGHREIDEEIGCACEIIKITGFLMTDRELKNLVVKK